MTGIQHVVDNIETEQDFILNLQLEMSKNPKELLEKIDEDDVPEVTTKTEAFHTPLKPSNLKQGVD